LRGGRLTSIKETYEGKLIFQERTSFKKGSHGRLQKGGSTPPILGKIKKCAQGKHTRDDIYQRPGGRSSEFITAIGGRRRRTKRDLICGEWKGRRGRTGRLSLSRTREERRGRLCRKSDARKKNAPGRRGAKGSRGGGGGGGVSSERQAFPRTLRGPDLNRYKRRKKVPRAVHQDIWELNESAGGRE